MSRPLMGSAALVGAGAAQPNLAEGGGTQTNGIGTHAEAAANPPDLEAGCGGRSGFPTSPRQPEGGLGEVRADGGEAVDARLEAEAIAAARERLGLEAEAFYIGDGGDDGGVDLERGGHRQDEVEEFDDNDPLFARRYGGGGNADEPTFWFDHGIQNRVTSRDFGLTQDQLQQRHAGGYSLRCLFCRRRARGVARLEEDRAKSEKSLQKRWEADAARAVRGGACALELEVATLAGGMLGRVAAGPNTTGAELRARVATLARVPEREVALVMANSNSPLADDALLATTAAETAALRAAPAPQLHMLRVQRRYALSGASDGTVRLWDAGRSQCLETLTGHTDRVTCCAADFQVRRALTGSSDGTLRLWDLDTSSCVETIRDYAGDFNAVAVNWEARRALGGLSNGTLAMWDLDEGTCVQALHGGHAGPVQCVAVNWEARRALSGSVDGCVMVWDLEIGSRIPMQGHMVWVSDVAVAPEGRYACSGSIDGMLRVWDLRTNGCVRTLKGTWGDVKCLDAHWDTARVLSGAGGGALKLWDLGMGRLVETLGGTPPLGGAGLNRNDMTSIAVDWEASRALSGSIAGEMTIWDLETKERLETWAGHGSEIKCLALERGI